MNVSSDDYKLLLEKYLDLQQRVTKFSSVEQDLINTRDLLDQELVSYKRLQQFSERALEDSTADNFHKLVAEAIVDIFEVQSAVVCVRVADEDLAVGAAEGIPEEQCKNPEFREALKSLKENLPTGMVRIITKAEMNNKQGFQEFSRILTGKFEEQAIQFSVMIIGLVNTEMDQLYPPFTAKKQTIFGIFLKQLQTIYANKIRNQELKKTNSELDSFVYSVSHDLRAPLLSLKGIIDLISETEPLPEEIRDYLKMADTSVTRLDTNIQEILEYSRNARLSVKHETFNFRTLVEEIFQDIQFAAGQPVELVLNFNENDMTTDRRRLKVLMNNVISNAIKYRKKNIPDAYVQIDFKANSDSYEVEVTDNGEGIPDESKPMVFDMFYRASTTTFGTGLGLYICREIIHKLNGTIEIESGYGTGTSVSFSIPRKNIENQNNSGRQGR